jgi:hypothetical protein
MNSGHANRLLSRKVEKLQHNGKSKNQNFLPLKFTVVQKKKRSDVQTEIKGGKPHGKKN